MHGVLAIIMSHAVFGSAEGIEPTEGLVAFVVIVSSVVSIEVLFHSIHKQTHESQYAELVSAIEKELMIVGATAFALKIITNATSILSEKWLMAIEFAGPSVIYYGCSFCHPLLFYFFKI